MIWFIVAVLIVLVLGVVAAFAAGAGGTMPEAFDDRVDARLPLGPLSESDVAQVRLPVAVRGYRMEEVDRLLDVLGAQLGAQQATIAELTEQLEGSASSAPAEGLTATELADTPELVERDESDEVTQPGGQHHGA